MWRPATFAVFLFDDLVGNLEGIGPHTAKVGVYACLHYLDSGEYANQCGNTQPYDGNSERRAQPVVAHRTKCLAEVKE